MVLDIETTGLSKFVHKITEIAAIRVENSKVTNKFATLINPQTHIPSFITSLTGISDSMVKDAPVIDEVMPEFIKFVRDAPFVAHCATFDHGFLKHNAQRYLSHELKNEKICTMKLSRRLLPELPRYRLSYMCEHFNIKNNAAHRAMGDAEATHELFGELLRLMKKRGIEKQEHILNFQGSKIKR